MYLLLLLAGISLALSLLLIPVCRDAALRWNLVDVPDTTRKLHRRPIPRIGGVPVMVAAAGSCLIAVGAASRGGGAVNAGFGAAWMVAPATAVMFLVGLADDVFGLRPWQKLAGQVLAAAFAVACGVHIGYVAGIPLPAWLGAAATIAWLVGCANALNLIDGVDGLAGGITLLASLTVMAAALLNGNMELAVAVAPLAGALIGFLVFNFNPASIFLGDCGSLVLGFLLGCYGVLWSEKSATALGMLAPAIAFSIPLLDMSLAIARRFLRRQPIFAADRSHIHHRMLARGLSPRGVALQLYMAAAIAGALALLFAAAPRPWEGAVAAVFLGGIVFAINRLEYVEFGAIGRFLASDSFRRALNGQIAVRAFEQKICVAVTPDDCWEAIETASKDFGFHHVEMQFAGRRFRRHKRVGPIRSWEIRIPISEDDWVELSHEFGSAGHSTAVVAFAEAICKLLGARSSMLARSHSEARVYTALVSD